MAVQELYRAEVAKRQAARDQECAPYEAALGQLTALYRSLIDDRAFMNEIAAEVELLDDDLRIDPGPIMIVVTALQEGGFKFEYEVKRPGGYASTALANVRTIEDAAREIARLLAEYPRYKD